MEELSPIETAYLHVTIEINKVTVADKFINNSSASHHPPPPKNK